ncbi:MAG TPA: hypothetical protein VMY35_12150 [Phycisphaerae bacterium]|nr:hypothetical protein [Phycisphaerae bacterium]
MAGGEIAGAGREETLREVAETTYALALQVEGCVGVTVGHLFGTDPEERDKCPAGSFRDTLVGARAALNSAACTLEKIRDQVASTAPEP